MSCYVEVAVNVPQVRERFDYHLPDEMASQVQPGSLVVVPFGSQMVQGIVTACLDAPRVAITRAVQLLVDPFPALTPAQLRLGAWLAHETLSSLNACLELMLPPGLGQQADTLYVLQSKPAESGKPLTRTQARLVQLLTDKGPLRGRQFDSAIKRVNWRPSMQSLIRQGRVHSKPVLQPPSVRPKTVRTAQLAVPPEEARRRYDDVGRAGSAAQGRRQSMLNALMAQSWPLDTAYLYAVSQGSAADLNHLAELGLVRLGESEVWRDPLEQMESVETEPPTLTNDQQRVWGQVNAALKESWQTGCAPHPHLLYGVTGSGKTEIYMRAVAETLRSGRQAIVMVPEIALTPQTVRRFMSRFPGRVGLVHSQLSPGERYDTWRRARAGQLDVIVGPRSALFTPLERLGLIVVDECHEDTYAQTDFDPHYHAIPAAVELGRLTGSLVLFGSATPEVGLMHSAGKLGWPILQLPARIFAHSEKADNSPVEAKTGDEALPLPSVQVVDMRQELASGNRSIFSEALKSSLQRVLENGQQAILYLNRRGTSTYVFCRECGESLRCPRCELPLTYHTNSGALICHTCNYRRNMPSSCPNCKSTQIRQFGAGTEKVEALAQQLFPQARLLRWDAETTRQKGAHDLLLTSFQRHQADILIGTQMLAKGLDLPLITLVGVVLADVGLSLPDFRAGERAFQLLTQVSGRAGRSPLGGQVILQTFQPEHYAIQAAAGHDYREFYRQEIAYRRRIGYPPFARLLRLEYRHTDSPTCEEAARALAARLRFWLDEAGDRTTEIIGPVPCFFARQNGQYRWQVILRGPDPVERLRGHALPENWRVEVDPVSLL